MIRKSNIYLKNVFVSALLLIAIFTQTAWLKPSSEDYYTIFISCSFATGFYASFGKKILPSILLTSIIGGFVAEITVGNTPVVDSLLYLLPFTFINVFTPLLFGVLMNLFKTKTSHLSTDAFYMVLSLVITSLIVSFLPALQMHTQNNTTFFHEYFDFSQSIMSGMLVFTVGIIMSNSYDSFFTFYHKDKLWEVLYFIGFAVITFTIFNNSSTDIKFISGASLFILLFIINAFLFSFRMLLVISYLYITIYNVVFFHILELSDIDFTSINIYLIVLFLITVFTKILIFELKQRNKELIETKSRYEDMLSSTLELLNVRETLSDDKVEYHESIMRNIFDISLRIFNKVEYATCTIRGDKYVEFVDSKGYNIQTLRAMKIDINKYRWNNYKPVHIKNSMKKFEDVLEERYRIFENELPEVKESVGILIKLGDNEKGAITFDIPAKSDSHFTDGDIYNIGAFQNMINSFYEMNELSIKNNSLRDDIVLSLIRTLELFDHYTGGHSEDVAFLASEISKSLNLPDSDTYNVYWAGIVHDIGKIGINSDIITKEGRLSLAEFNIVKQHPIFGYEILSKSEDLKTIAKLVKHHHEWYNGTGYPDGLKGNEIPYGSQILQVADSVSSMATKRTYQVKRSFEEIIQELQLYSGVQFNPEITEIMIQLIKDGVVENYFKSHTKK